jgi:hypothetical protein
MLLLFEFQVALHGDPAVHYLLHTPRTPVAQPVLLGGTARAIPFLEDAALGLHVDTLNQLVASHCGNSASDDSNPSQSMLSTATPSL